MLKGTEATVYATARASFETANAAVKSVLDGAEVQNSLEGKYSKHKHDLDAWCGMACKPTVPPQHAQQPGVQTPQP